MSDQTATPVMMTAHRRRRATLEALQTALSEPWILLCLGILSAFVFVAIFADLIAGDPFAINPAMRLRPPSEDALWGTDQLGRDIFARAMHGTRMSLTVGLSVALLSAIPGLALGILAGMSRMGGQVIMRLVDAMMAIPAVLLAIALAALLQPGLTTVIIAITLPEIPRMVRLVRSVVLSVKAQPM